MQDVRVAMIGGRGHHFITAAFGSIEGVTLAAVAADGFDDAAERYRNSEVFGDAKYCEDPLAMLDEVKPDLVSIGPRAACNARFICAALERNIHVVSDKPIADSVEELAQIKALLAAKPDRLLLTEFDMRAGDAWRAMRHVVREGRIGEPILVTGQKSYRFGESRPDYYKTRQGYPGTFAFIGCHVVDLAYYVTGLKYISAEGLQGNLAKKDYGRFEDHAACLARLENGGTAMFHVDYLRPAAAPTHGDDRLRVVGSDGVVETREETCVLITKTDQAKVIASAPRSREGVAREIIATVRGEGMGVFSNEDSLYIAETMLGIREALDTGRKVDLG